MAAVRCLHADSVGSREIHVDTVGADIDLFSAGTTAASKAMKGRGQALASP